jgi:hypothetical protein
MMMVVMVPKIFANQASLRVDMMLIGIEPARARRRTRSPTYEAGRIKKAGGDASGENIHALRGFGCLRFDV